MTKKHRKNYNTLPQSNPLHHVMELVSIVIPVYGRFDLLEKCLDALPEAAGDISYNVVLVDNNSPEKSEADAFYVRYPKATVIRNKENIGFPRACNMGARRKASPLLFFLNSDAIMHSRSIWHMVKAMDDPQVGVVGAKLLYPDDSKDPNRPAGRVQHVGIAIDISGRFNHIFMGWSPDHPKVRSIKDVAAVTGAALMTRRNLWNKIGGFDENYGLGTWEDCAFCFSAAGLGYKIQVTQEAMGTHHTSATAMKYNIRYPITFNQSIFMSTWGTKISWTDWQYW